MSNLNWPESATHYGAETKEFNPGFYKYVDGKWLFMSEYGAPNGVWYHIGPGDDSARYVERPKQPQAWSGPEDGLPPVNERVEVLWSSITGQYVEGIILAHDEDRAVFRFVTGERKGEYQADKLHFSSGKLWPNFRPIKTPAQQAADKRETAIRELMDIAQVDCRVTAARLVDAGFKREAV